MKRIVLRIVWKWVWCFWKRRIPARTFFSLTEDDGAAVDSTFGTAELLAVLAATVVDAPGAGVVPWAVVDWSGLDLAVVDWARLALSVVAAWHKINQEFHL